jgi:6,7-dimethyl-8-ribityllumazine synthase
MATENKNLSDYDKIQSKRKNFRFGIVVSEWNDSITEGLFKGALSPLENQVPAQHIIRWNVPGSFELIYGSKKMLQTQNVDAVIAIGCVIQGQTKHFGM